MGQPRPIDVLYWRDVTAAIRALLRRDDVVGVHWAASAYLFCANLYGQRSQSETVNTRFKRKYGAFVCSQCWWKQFHEPTVGCPIHNIDKAL